MHILIVTDQHPESLGGAQVAIRTQRTALEQLGHLVSIAAPRLHRQSESSEAYIDLPSRPITRDNEYGLSWPSRRTDRALAAALRSRPRVDLVHVQGDFWGAMIGIRVARGLRVPLVFTMHNNVDQGTRAVTPFAGLVFRALRVWRGISLRRPRGKVSRSSTGAWRYLAELAAEAAAVIAPSQHFADLLESEGVATEVAVIRGGIDDELMRKTLRSSRSERQRPRLVWLGRMSHEKRVLEFIEALARSNVDADVRLFGAGLLLEQVQARISAANLEDRVVVIGPVTHERALYELHEADALVQTSVGFETQGLTPFEAAALGTPTIYCDAAIAADVGVVPAWNVPNSASNAGNAADEVDAAIDALAETLREAVQQLQAGLGDLRVGESEASAFMQSEQTRRLVSLYERVLQP